MLELCCKNFSNNKSFFYLTNKFTFLKGFSKIESRLVRKMFLQLKIDIFSGDQQRLEPDVRKKIKKDLEKQLEAFNTFYEDFRRTRIYNSRREMKIFQKYLQKSLKYYSFLILIWEENELRFIKK